MQLNFILITKENAEGFKGVLPDDMISTNVRFSLGAYDDSGNVLGAVSYTVIEYQYEVDWLYVEPKVRRQKIGTELMDRVIAAASETMEIFPISVHYTCTGEDDPLHCFFMFYGKMDVNYSHERYLIRSGDIPLAPILHKKLKMRHDRKLFFEEPENTRKRILEMLRKDENYVIEDYELWEKTCEKELCQCIYVGNSLMDAIFIQKNPDGSLELSFLYSRYPEGLLSLITSVAEEIEVKYPGHDLTFDAINTQSESIAKKLFPKAESQPVFEAEW